MTVSMQPGMNRNHLVMIICSFFILNKYFYMKSLFLSLVLVATTAGLFAQKLDKAKDLLGKKKLTEARTEIDNFLANPKNQNNSEAWYVKSKVYGTIAM